MYENSVTEFLNTQLVPVQKRLKKLEMLRSKFLQTYPAELIREITLDEYVVGKGSHTSFCYQLETTLREYGSIKGGSTADKKFGLYYSKDDGDYKNLKRWGEDSLTAFSDILTEISKLVEWGQDLDLDAISSSKLSPMFRGKILSVYLPNDYLPIFSTRHVEHFLDKLNVPYSKASTIEAKRNHLLDFKNSSAFSKYDNYVFTQFLYWWCDPSITENTLSEVEVEHFLNATDINACYITEEKLVRYRRLNQKILTDLKKLYDNRCQLCGTQAGIEFGPPVAEAHHIDYFSKSQNNNQNNIIVLCPNCHSILHRNNPTFDKKDMSFVFKNGKRLPLIHNEHL
ncbi:HNH endonuclease [Bengtsoniella intestinalis]|uniref:HNH endonuclease n=1 Tax=Bengtsoniella intestinalis TaxID=3073143 RepID=UPI00391FA7F4